MAFSVTGFATNLASYPALATMMAVSLGAASAWGLASTMQPQNANGAMCGDPYGGCLPTLDADEAEVRHPLFRPDAPQLSLSPKISGETRLEQDDSREGDVANWVFIGFFGVLALVGVVSVVRDGMTKPWDEERADDPQDGDYGPYAYRPAR